MAFRLTLIRHGVADGAEQAIFGHSNPALSILGREQLAARWTELSAHPVDAIASSTLARAADFALDAAMSLGIALHLERGFDEMNLGSIDGKAKADWSTAEHAAWDAWQNDPAAHPLPDGETWDAFSLRVQTALDKWIASGDAEHRVLIAHQGTIKAILLNALGLPAARHSQFWLAPAGCITLWWDQDWPPMILGIQNHLPDAR
ncbi:histidine phosphatase family protein [Deefgea piscis]|uniref:histidine phosphatase family protein n=1 Tax=Deefgea piscis TaxID=2739061 RepID=UPI001C7EE3A2|nr:histidine phosphatase family protein [Deefgea piscis]QZA81579.1 histidine phosphatase family protein [Deefgea piscis]